MKRSETALVLAKIAIGYNRRLDPPDARDTPILDFWHEQIGDLDLRDSLTAVRDHFRNSGEYLRPVHVRSAVKEIRWSRIAGINDGDLTLDLDPDAPIGDYLATTRARASAIEGGMPIPQAIATIAPVKAIEAAQ